MATVPTKKYQKKLMKVTKLTDIVILVLAIFEMSLSKTFKDSKIDEWKFATLQALHLGLINKLANVNHKMEAEIRF